MTAKEMIQRMPEVFNAQSAGDTRAVIQYEISEPMYQVVENGELHVYEGVAEHADLTLKMSDKNLVKLFKGELNPAMAFMTGKIKLRGDMQLAQRLVGFVDRDKVAQLA